MLKNLNKRLELAERAAAEPNASEDCICFPAKEPPVFDSDEDQDAAYVLKCRIHGDRFQQLFHLYRHLGRRNAKR
jgi:hypothetical protein